MELSLFCSSNQEGEEEQIELSMQSEEVTNVLYKPIVPVWSGCTAQRSAILSTGSAAVQFEVPTVIRISEQRDAAVWMDRS